MLLGNNKAASSHNGLRWERQRAPASHSRGEDSLTEETGRKPSLPQKASNTSTAFQATHSIQDPEASIANTIK